MSCVVDTNPLIYFLAEAADATVLRASNRRCGPMRGFR
jgi:hypothetical protein